MSDELAQTLSTKLDLVLAEVRALSAKPKPGLRQTEFAKLIGKSPRTVSRMVRRGSIRLKDGLVPAKYFTPSAAQPRG